MRCGEVRVCPRDWEEESYLEQLQVLSLGSYDPRQFNFQSEAKEKLKQ